MASETKIEWCDSTHNPWIGCTKVSPACDHCYASVSTPVRTKGIVWGAGQPRQRTSEANWKLPVKWNRMDFGQCPGCGWRGTGILTCQADEHGSDRKCPICIRATPDGPEYISYLKPSRRRVFCASLADVFDNEAPIEWLVDLLDLIRRTPNLDWLLLTKRIGNWRRRLEDAVWYLSGPAGKVLDILGTRRAWIASWLLGTAVPTNVWLGATICNQQEADRDVPKLLQVPALVRFLSIEPMLEAIRVDDIAGPGGDGVMKPLCGLWHKRSELSGRMRPTSMSKIDWVICGGESGPHARPMHPDWVRSLRDQCAAAGVPFLFKQWGEWAPGEVAAQYLQTRSEAIADWLGDRWEYSTMTPTQASETHTDDAPDVWWVGKKKSGNLLDGRQHFEWPV